LSFPPNHARHGRGENPAVAREKPALVKSLVTTEAGFFKSLTRDDVSLLFG